eukprot:EG_transcript_839
MPTLWHLLLCFAWVGAAAADALGPCQARDYVPVYGPCNQKVNPNQRTVRFVRNSTCTGPEELLQDIASCDCRPDEYEPRYGDCQGGARAFTGYSVRTDCRVSRAMPHPASVPCACTDADIVAEYTKCDPATGQQRLVHYFVSSCDPTGKPLPPPQIMPCALTCPSGQFLAPPHTTCQACPAGTFSVRGVVVDEWPQLPPDFHTSCVGAFCKGWEAHGTYVDSGNQDHAGTLSSLQFYTKVMAPVANITVTFRVESQWYWDFFIVTINGVRQDLDIEDVTGINKEWSTVTLDLHQQECEAELYFHSEAHCLIRNYFDPPIPGAGQFVDHDAITGQEIAIPYAPYNGCEAAAWDGLPVAGRLAVVRRGNCTFAQKAGVAQEQGAIGLVIVNLDNDPVRMIGDGSALRIPVAIIGAQGGDPLLEVAESGEAVRVDVLPTTVTDAKVEFYYSKWSNTAKREEPGADRVFIKSIRTEGTVRSPKECHPCQPGEYSPPGSPQCLPCPANTYSDRPGLAQCIPCGYHRMSLPGATECSGSVNCTLEDYIATYGPCHQTSTGKLVAPVSYRSAFDPPLCSGGLAQPSDTEVDCPACPAGLVRNAASGECEPCEPGYQATAGGCQPCPAGTAAVKQLSYDPFPGTLPSSFKTSCNGQCLDPWHFVTVKDGDRYVTALAAGKGLAIGSQAVLQVTAALYTDGAIRFRHFDIVSPGAKSRPLRAAVFELKRVGTGQHPYHLEGSLPPSPFSGQIMEYSSGPVSAGTYHLVFSYNRTEGVEFVLRSLVVTGEGSGGASECVPCPTGMFCPLHTDMPYPCDAGQYTSETGSVTCHACPHGRIADATHTRCEECAAPLVPHPVGRYCVMPGCRYTTQFNGAPVTYDLGRFGLIEAQEGKKSDSGKEVTATYHFSLCAAIQDLPETEDKELKPDKLCGVRDSPSFACQVVTGAPPIVLGSAQQVAYQPPATPLASGSLSVLLTSGDLCSGGRRYQATVKLQCVPPSGTGGPVDTKPRVRVALVADCEYEVTVASPLSCPLCTNSSYTYGLGPCKDNRRQTRSWFLKDGVQCYGGIVKAEEEVLCERTVEVSFGLNTFTLTVAACSFVFLALFAALVAMVFQNRKIYEQYQRVSGNANAEMTDLDEVPCAQDDDLDGPEDDHNDPLDDADGSPR